MRKNPLAQMLAIGAVASVVMVAITLIIDWFPDRAAPAASKIDTLYDVLLIASVPIFVLVMTVAIYSVVKFRARPGDERDGAPIHGHTRLEIIWVTIPFLLVTGLAIYGWIVLNDIEAKKPDELLVNVTGRQFTWSFDYPQEKVSSNVLVLPKDRPVEFKIRTKDVIHSFWVPEFRLKSDAVPGLTTHVRLTPDRLGRYEVVCAELCGLGHSTMRQGVRVLPEREFAAWLDARRAPTDPARSLEEGRRLFTSLGCAGCHTLFDAGSGSETGPPLEGLGEIYRSRKRGVSLREYLRQSIVDPKALVVKGFSAGGMPANYGDQLSDRQIDVLVEYLARTTVKR
jgi:cytochrome c oxidase subunit 2